MTSRAAARREEKAAAQMRRIVESHFHGELSLAGYRRQRRALLDAVRSGEPLPGGSGRGRGRARLVWYAVVVLAIAALIGWWLARA